MTSMQLINNLAPKKIPEASVKTMWMKHEKDCFIYQSDNVGLIDSFYPVYRYQNYFSYSILALILLKGRFVLSDSFLHHSLPKNNDIALPNPTIDAEIERLAGNFKFRNEIVDIDEFVEIFCNAFSSDIDNACYQNPAARHFVLCGGKDSLNILLHKWNCDVTVLSAHPNHSLVANFIADNNLDYDLMLLEDIAPSDNFDREVAECSALADLQHWKWTEHLRQIAHNSDQPAIFWKGQVADAFFTDYWKSYTSNRNSFVIYAKKAAKNLSKYGILSNNGLVSDYLLSDLENSLWERAAVGQGGHLGFLRSICNALFLSAYHGPETTKVIQSMDIRQISNTDLRPRIGRRLHGREVIYPTTNPAPPASSKRPQGRDVNLFINTLKRHGVACDVV